MPRKSKIPWRNRNATGWWVYQKVEQWVSNRQKKLTPNSRCLVWENIRIIKAKNRHEAFRKAMRLGRSSSPSKTIGGEWRFAGISLLLPIYDDIEDGAEILWTDCEKMRVKDIQKLVKAKDQLSVFNDEEEGA
jgi:hypothetical protein